MRTFFVAIVLLPHVTSVLYLCINYLVLHSCITLCAFYFYRYIFLVLYDRL